MRYDVRRQLRANTPLEQFELDMISRGLSTRTIRDRVATVQRCADERPPEGLDQITVARFLSNPGWGQSTRCTHWSELNAFFVFLVLHGIRDDSPMTPRPRQPRRQARPVAPEHLLRLLGTRMAQKTRLKVLLAAFAGLRVHEIAKVKGEHVDRVTQTLTVRGKGGHTYTVPLHPVILEASKYYPERGYWFPRCVRGEGIDTSRPMGGKAVSDVIGRTMRRAGVPGTPHGLRHYFATELVKADVDLRTVQELMRHSSLQTTQIYVAIPDERRRAAVDRLRVPELSK